MTLVRGTRKDRIEKFFSAQRLRLRDDSKWELLPAGISFTIAMLFIGHLLPGLNPRLGNRANIMELEAKNEPDGSIWLGVFIKDGSFYIQTSDRKLLRFNADDLDKPTLPSLISYLRHRREKEVALLGTSMSYQPFRSNIVVAVDQSLKFVHFRPIVNSIAASGYRRYSFETRAVLDSNKSQALKITPTRRL